MSRDRLSVVETNKDIGSESPNPLRGNDSKSALGKNRNNSPTIELESQNTIDQIKKANSSKKINSIVNMSSIWSVQKQKLDEKIQNYYSSHNQRRRNKNEIDSIGNSSVSVVMSKDEKSFNWTNVKLK